MDQIVQVTKRHLGRALKSISFSHQLHLLIAPKHPQLVLYEIFIFQSWRLCIISKYFNATISQREMLLQINSQQNKQELWLARTHTHIHTQSTERTDKWPLPQTDSFICMCVCVCVCPHVKHTISWTVIPLCLGTSLLRSEYMVVHVCV